MAKTGGITLEDLKSAAPEQLDELMAAYMIQVREQAVLELKAEQAVEDAAKAELAAQRKIVRDKRQQAFGQVQPLIGEVAEGLIAWVEPEAFTRKEDDGKGNKVDVPAGFGYKVGGEMSVTMPDGTIKLARVDLSVVWDDTNRRKAVSLPSSATTPAVLEGRLA